MADSDLPHPNNSSAAVSINWPAVLAKHGRWLRTVALARVGDAHAADEVMQEVAVAAVENEFRLRDRAKLAPWLYRLVVVAGLQYRRRQGRRRKLARQFASQRPHTHNDTCNPDPFAWLVSQEQRTLVRTALNNVPHRDAEMLLLKYTEDWTYRQLAEHLGKSTSAVEAHLHRARRRLRQEIAKLDPSLAGDS